MKLVIPSEGPNPTDSVDPRFGRAKFLILIDTKTETHMALDNAAGVDAQQGAGVLAARKVVELGADALLTGHCGPKAFDILTAAGVKVHTAPTGSVAAALRAMWEGELPCLTVPNGLGRH